MNASGASRHGWALRIALTCTAATVCVCPRAYVWARRAHACVRDVFAIYDNTI